jgi:hypothetical protein
MQPSAQNAFYRMITCQNREVKPTMNQNLLFRQSIPYLSEDHLDDIIDDEQDESSSRNSEFQEHDSHPNMDPGSLLSFNSTKSISLFSWS